MDFIQIFIPSLEILIIAIVVYYLLSFFWNTRAMDLLYGILIFLILYAATNWFELPVLQKLLLYVANVAVLGFIILFQPELRLALSKVTLKNKRYREITEFDKFIEHLAQSVYRLSDRKIGALIVLENQDALDDLVNKAVVLNSEFSSELLESIFITTTPLHDGAVIIRGTTILSAATILPLANDSTQVAKSMGTRHRAGLGTSQTTDALIIVVSEETGKVSIARDGIMTRGVKIDRFKGIIRSVFNPPKTSLPSSNSPWERIRQWIR